MISKSDITCMVLAGGQGQRMGGMDKGLMRFEDHSLIQKITAALAEQTEHILINANRNLEEYKELGFPVVSDTLADFQGPLAGLLTGMKSINTDYVLTVPCDAPALPNDLVQRMCDTINEGADIAVAHDGERFQPVYALVPARLRNSLESFLSSGQRKIIIWYRQHNLKATDFSDCPNTFFNINTPKDKAELET